MKQRIRERTEALARAVKYSMAYQGYMERPLDENLYFLESRNGREIASNILRIMLYLKEREDLGIRMVTAANKDKIPAVRTFLREYGLGEVKVLPYASISYYRTISRAKYLINDVTFPRAFIKKPGQIYLNTWHGTPFKAMGLDDTADRGKIDNIQRNFFMSDILLFPSEYCRDRMMHAHNLDGLYEGNVLLAGYPRNTVFFDNVHRQKIRESYGVAEQQVYLYLPTFREASGSEEIEKQAAELENYLQQLDAGLKEGEVLYIKLHNLVHQNMREIRFEEFHHIRLFPTGIETYEFLNAADCLITDYSSVMYDFALTGRKIIRFVYDEEAYFRNRGFYEQPVEIPFPKVRTVTGLLSELRCARGYNDAEFLETFCRYDNRNATEIVMRALRTMGRRMSEEAEKSDGKEVLSPKQKEVRSFGRRVFVYGGGLKINGITSSLFQLLNRAEGSEIQLCLGVEGAILSREKDLTARMPENVKLLEFDNQRIYRLPELLAVKLYEKRNLSFGWIRRSMDRLYQRECRRTFAGMPFDAYVQYTGYNAQVIRLLQRAPGRRILFSHSDMYREYELKKKIHLPTYRDAYNSYDCVAVVAERLKVSVEKISGKPNRRTAVVHNLQDEKEIREKGGQPIHFGGSTRVVPEITEEQLEIFLQMHPGCIAHVGRYSPEKNHRLLLDSFERYLNRHPNAGLILMGGSGDSYEEVREMIRSETLAGNVIMIENIPNPMPVLQKCGLLLLTSDYEGQPMVFFEAEALGVPSLAVRNPGCREFMEEFGGTLAEPVADAIAEKLEDYAAGKIGRLFVDFDEYNQNAWKEFKDCLY